MYGKKVMQYFKNPKFAKKIKNPDGIGKKGNSICGDQMEVSIKVKNNKIINIGYQTLGCVAAISSSESLCRLAKEKTIDQALKITDKDIIKHLGMKAFPEIKYHCSILGSETLKLAIKDYKRRLK